jgi:peptidyl-tRNA hydrolase
MLAALSFGHGGALFRSSSVARQAPTVLQSRVNVSCRMSMLGGSDTQAPDAVVADAAVAAAAAEPLLEQQPQQDPIVQWVVLRRDLWTDIGWPLGPVIAQACHASSAAMALHLDDADTREYLAAANLDHMHKVVLEVRSEAQLRTLSERLAAAGVLHKLWVEQPEDYATCLATKPYRRSQVGTHFRKLQLCKAMLAKA